MRSRPSGASWKPSPAPGKETSGTTKIYSEPVVENDAKGVGPLLLAYTELLAEQANR